MNKITTQQVFMLFFAIFWGFVANVQPRWKAFNWPLVFRRNQAGSSWRALLSMIVLNIAPALFFAHVLCALGKQEMACNTGSRWVIVLHGVFPALAAFGFYRIWMGIVEFKPDCFYVKLYDRYDTNKMPREDLFSEPTYARASEYILPTPPKDISNLRHEEMPVVCLGSWTSGILNFVWGVAYIIVFGFISRSILCC